MWFATMFSRSTWITISLFLVAVDVIDAAENLTCYQCIKTENEECQPSDLKQCPPEKDRCVTHITKDADNGFSIKRECGLGPCNFEDNMMNRGLGLDGCDRSKDEYFCLFCCRKSGCNKSSGNITRFITTFDIIIATANVFLLALCLSLLFL